MLAIPGTTRGIRLPARVSVRLPRRLRSEPPPFDLHRALTDARRYTDHIERMHERSVVEGRGAPPDQQGVSLASLAMRSGAAGRLLARAIERGEYSLEPARRRTVRVGTKDRVVYAYRMTDAVVHGVVADLIAERVAPHLSSSLYSYRPGVSWWTPISAFAAYARKHVKERPDPRMRGLYVLRRDVHAYTDSIPVGAGSPVWAELRAHLVPPGAAEPRTSDWAVIEQVIRPEVYVEPQVPATHVRGVATGQPISVVLFNLYLAPLDAELDAIPGAFYARYGDDLLFAHADHAVAAAASARIAAVLADRGLASNPKKSRDLYLTAAGRADPLGTTRGVQRVGFLGADISANGTVSLDRGKRRELLRELRRRADATGRALRGSDLDRRGRAVAATIDAALDPDLPDVAVPSAALLRRAVTDRDDLQALDHEVARIVLHAVTGRRDAAAFRQVPWRRMRAWGLVSLVGARNGSAPRAPRATRRRPTSR